MVHRKTLAQICDVLEHMTQAHANGTPLQVAYEQAAQIIADRYQVTYQTIGDACRKRLDLQNIQQFQSLTYRWLTGRDRQLQDVILNAVHPDLHRLVNQFFTSVIPQPSTAVVNMPQNHILSVSIPQEVLKQFHITAAMQETTVDALAERLLRDAIQAEYQMQLDAAHAITANWS